MAKPNRNRGDNREIEKMSAELVRDEKRGAHRRRRIQALCTHTSSPQHPDVTPNVLPNGKKIWICRKCQRKMDMTAISEDKLKEAIEVIANVCDFIKISSPGSERDQHLNEEVISEIEFKCTAFLMDAYKAAKKASNKANNRGGSAYGGGGSGKSIWTE